MSQDQQSAHNGFDIDEILQKASTVEKISLLSGNKSPVPAQVPTLIDMDSEFF
jgi:hypothetical protein